MRHLLTNLTLQGVTMQTEVDLHIHLCPELDENHVLVGRWVPDDAHVLDDWVAWCSELQQVMDGQSGRYGKHAQHLWPQLRLIQACLCAVWGREQWWDSPLQQEGSKIVSSSTLSSTDALFLVEVEDAMSHVHHRVARDKGDSILDGTRTSTAATAILSKPWGAWRKYLFYMFMIFFEIMLRIAPFVTIKSCYCVAIVAGWLSCPKS